MRSDFAIRDRALNCQTGCIYWDYIIMLEARPGSDFIAENRFSMASDPVPSRSNFCTFCWPPRAGKTEQVETETFLYSTKTIHYPSIQGKCSGLSKIAMQNAGVTPAPQNWKGLQSRTSKSWSSGWSIVTVSCAPSKAMPPKLELPDELTNREKLS